MTSQSRAGEVASKIAAPGALHITATASSGGGSAPHATSQAVARASTMEPCSTLPCCTLQLPVFDLAPYLEAPESDASWHLCTALAACLHETSALVVRDPRVDSGLNDRFLDLMERYFDQPLEAKMADVRADLSYQIGERPASTKFAELNAAPVVPAAFAGEWTAVMDTWGNRLLATVEVVAQMAARGLGLEADAITTRMRHGPHLLAPTGSDLGQHSTPGTVFAGFHYDLNLLTIHGRSRYPGLHIWLRDGRRVPVRIPEGCLLLQAGKQLEWLTGGPQLTCHVHVSAEWLTGGFIRAGFHEVVCTTDTLTAAERAKAEGRPLWRVSSTVFSQVASDQQLLPLGRFATAEALTEYPPVPAGQQVQQELAFINLGSHE